MGNKLFQASTVQQAGPFPRAIPEDDDPFFANLRDLFYPPVSCLHESLMKQDIYTLLGNKGMEVDSTYGGIKGKYKDRLIGFGMMVLCREELVLLGIYETLSVEFVTCFLEDLAVFRNWKPDLCLDRRVLGAVAYLDVEGSAEEYAEGKGLYLIRATMDTIDIINRPDFHPRLFG